MADLTRDMQIVADVIGETATIKLMTEIGGTMVYIPKPQRSDIEAMLIKNCFDAKVVAAKSKVSLRKVYTILKEMRAEREFKRRQLNLFEHE